jgi:predicted transcriptional regulator
MSEFIKKSKERIGELYPVLEANDGEVLDGRHRLNVGWGDRRRLERIKTPLDKLAVRFIANFDRRTMTFEEKKELIDRIAEELIKTGVAKPSDNSRIAEHLRDRPVVVPLICELLGVDEQTVYTYLSDRFKRTTGRIDNEPRTLEEVKRQTTRKRAVFEIRGDILKELSKASLKPTNLMYKTNLSWKPLKTHLEFLQFKGLIDYTEGGEFYLLTPKGRRVLTHYLYVEHLLMVPEVEPTVKLEVVETSLRSIYRKA